EESEDRKWIGKRVVGEINLACGACEWCARGLGRHCPNRTVLGIVRHPGAFAEYLTLPERNLHALPDSISTEQAVFAEPLAAACEILDQVKITVGEPVAVLGDGKLGLLIAQVLHAHGAQVMHFGRHREKLKISASCGIHTERAGKRLPKHAFPIVVDATGSSSGLAQAVGMTLPRGMVIMKSTVHDRVALDAAPVIVNEISLIGSRCGRFEPALRLLRACKVQVQPLIADRFPLRDATAAFKRAAERGVIKVLFAGF
ncbi:MAG: alcohol dehydrogenase catalytic domain-containing protein, partial [Bryobacteraceae bacterium]